MYNSIMKCKKCIKVAIGHFENEPHNNKLKHFFATSLQQFAIGTPLKKQFEVNTGQDVSKYDRLRAYNV